MMELSLAEARFRFWCLLLVAALGAFEKEDDSFRVIYDGSHGVKVNYAIVPRDQVRVPSMAEMRSMLYHMRGSGLR